MPGDEKTDGWLKLCEQASKEHDSRKLMALIAEINRLLEAKEQLLKRRSHESRA